jgi:hypothetical protein
MTERIFTIFDFSLAQSQETLRSGEAFLKTKELW